jgi:hypothetical protein
VGSAGHRLLGVLIAIAVSFLMRPSELLAADAPTSARCGQSDDIVRHNPPRPAMLPRHHDAQHDSSDIAHCGPGEELEWLEPAAPAALPVIEGASASSVARARARGCTWARGPPR